MVSTRRRTAHPDPSDELRAAQANGSGTGVTLQPPEPGDAAGEEQANKPFARAWSEPDELRILECLAEHVKKHRARPARAQMLGLDKEEFTVTRIYEKVRRLRKRYEKIPSTPRPAKAPEVRALQGHMGQGHRASAGAGEEPRQAAPSVPLPRRRGGADQRRRVPRQGGRCSQEGIRVHG
uniref:Glabrous enhancer-binding protein-like DBD domain-containing protein n=1 Tax=Oryza brachyantha TaxID=4533 RepID=J3MVN4_ORYBR